MRSKVENINDKIKKIPLYNSLYGEKLKYFDFHKNLSKYPFLERSHIVEGFPNNWIEQESRDKIDLNLVETTSTSGTSGQRIQIIRKKNWWRDEYIRTYKYSNLLKSIEVGVTKKAILTTAICSNSVCYSDSPSYEDRIISNTLYLNLSNDPNDWSESDVIRMASELNKFKPEYLDADPVYLALFLKKIEMTGKKVHLHQPKVITLSYELVTAYAKKYIENHLTAPLVNLYGTTEVGYIYIEDQGKLIRCSDLCYVELVPFCERKGIYSLVLSSLKNEFMPFIRYRNGDLVKVGFKGEVDDEIDGSTIDYICGREKDVIINFKNEPVTPGEVDYFLSKLNNNILVYQLQFRHRNLLFRYIASDNTTLSETQVSEISGCLLDLFGEDYRIQFKLEKSIAPDLSGKFSVIKKL